jgi:hypothetical protein
MTPRTEKIEVRVSVTERAEIDRRVPSGVERSTWLRQIALGEPIARKRLRVVRSRISQPSAPELARIRALCAAAEAISELVANVSSRTDAPTISELQKLRGHVREIILSTP